MSKFFKKDNLLAICLFIATLIIYLISNFGRDTPYNYFVLLADAFLHGRLHLLDNPSWLNELIPVGEKYYVVYPPMPAVLLLPFVAIFGINFPQPLLSILLAAGNVVLCFLVLQKIFMNRSVAFWASILYAFGTIQWYHAQVGSAWYMAIIEGMFFVWLAILETITKSRLFLIGLYIGFAYLSRLPTILAIVFPLIYLWRKFVLLEDGKLKGINFKNFIFLGYGLAIPVFVNFAYNFVRFGTIFNIAYKLLPVFDEPWYRYGLFNIRYIPAHLKEMFTALPKFRSEPPYIIPSMYVMAIWFTTPAFIFALLARFRMRIVFASLLALVVISIPDLAHGANGFTQFGYRYLMDFYPFLLILTASGMRGKATRWAILLIVLSILVNLWGVIMLSFFDIWTW